MTRPSSSSRRSSRRSATGEALVRTEWISLDPTNRTWIEDTPATCPRCRSASDARASGSAGSSSPSTPATRRGSWSRACSAGRSTPLPPTPRRCSVCPRSRGSPPALYLGVLGMTGLTAWVGMKRNRQAASGRDGRRLSRRRRGRLGRRPAREARRRARRRHRRRAGEVLDARPRSSASTRPSTTAPRTGASSSRPPRPDGIDVDFENVGGEIMDAIFARLNLRARVALCGLISGYNERRAAARPARAFGSLLIKRAPLQGFIVLDHFDQARRGPAQLGGVDRRGPARAAGDRRRGLRAAARGDQHAVRRRERRQARRAGRRVVPIERRLTAQSTEYRVRVWWALCVGGGPGPLKADLAAGRGLAAELFGEFFAAVLVGGADQ